MPPAIELTDLHKSYGEVEALRGISLIVNEGEVVAVLGPNGAGKTTAISVMLGLRRPTRGTVRLFGMDPGDRNARSRCGVMLQESGVNGRLWVKDLVAQFRTYWPNPLSVDRAIAMAGLEAQSRTPSAKLSSGQRQRLYYALAICGDPDLLFLDEPTVSMDVQARARFLDSIRDFAAAGKTIVLSTHYLDEADQLAERIVIIDRGRIVADGTPEQIKSAARGKRVTFESDRQLMESDFRSLPVSRVEIHGRRVRLLTPEPEAVLSDLMRRGVTVRGLEVGGADLVEAFLALTARDEVPTEMAG